MPVFEYEAEYPCSAEGLFDFLSRPANLMQITRPDIGLKFNTAPEVTSEGAQLDFQIMTMGQVIKASHKITAFERPRQVIEQQITGPMKAWVHHHTYEVTSAGTVKRDRIEFQLPGGLIGLLLSESKVKDHLEDGMFHNEQKLRELIQQGVIA